MTHELLGNHKPSSEWFTPDDIWGRVERTFDCKSIYDPCPRGCLDDGLAVDWTDNYNYVLDMPYIYVNPPTPAAPWALKAIQTHLEHPGVNIIFACFSEAVLWQVNDLMDFPVCWVRNRINWIDGNQWVKCDSLEGYARVHSGSPYYKIENGKYYKTNPNYLKPAKSPRNYNAFVCLSTDEGIIGRFIENFQDLGTIRLAYTLG